jgi:hypothetical protein
MNADIKAIKERRDKATPGPWMWNVNEHGQQMELVTKHSGQYIVMGFDRWGMHSAQPTFQVYEKYEGPVTKRGSKGMKKAIQLSKWAQDYRHNDGWVEHPDADFIAHAWEDETALLAEIESLQVQLSESQRREWAAVEILRTIDWVGSGAKGRIEDVIGILSGIPGRDE